MMLAGTPAITEKCSVGPVRARKQFVTLEGLQRSLNFMIAKNFSFIISLLALFWISRNV